MKKKMKKEKNIHVVSSTALWARCLPSPCHLNHPSHPFWHLSTCAARNWLCASCLGTQRPGAARWEAIRLGRPWLLPGSWMWLRRWRASRRTLPVARRHGSRSEQKWISSRPQELRKEKSISSRSIEGDPWIRSYPLRKLWTSACFEAQHTRDPGSTGSGRRYRRNRSRVPWTRTRRPPVTITRQSWCWCRIACCSKCRRLRRWLRRRLAIPARTDQSK